MLTLLAAVVAFGFAFVAVRAVMGNLPVLNSWTRVEGTVMGLSYNDRVEVELGTPLDSRRVYAMTPEHQLGLSFLSKVVVYADPSSARPGPQRFRAGGVLQFWLWPATLAGVAFLLVWGAMFLWRAGRVEEEHASAGQWMFNASPAPMATSIRLHAPASHGKASLFWSLFGVCGLAWVVYYPGGTPFQRFWPGCLCGFLVVFTLVLALESLTMEISADDAGVRKTTALGWNFVPWEAVKRFELQRTLPVRRSSQPGFFLEEKLTFPGRATEGYAFMGANGFSLMRISVEMEPASAMDELFDMCARKTGLHPEKRTYEIPDF